MSSKMADYSSNLRDDEIAVKMVILIMKNYQSWLSSNQKIRYSNKLFGKQANVLKTNVRYTYVSSSPKEGLYTASGDWASAVEKTDSVDEAEANNWRGQKRAGTKVVDNIMPKFYAKIMGTAFQWSRRK